MTKNWQKVPLGKVITYRKEFIEIDDTQEYKRCRVKLHAKGVVLRDVITGAQIKTKQQQVCWAGEFLVAEIDAKVGRYGIVPDSLEGAIVSSHYFLFTIDNTQLDRRFLGYFIRTPEFRDQVNAQGSTNYAAIRPKHVLNSINTFTNSRKMDGKFDKKHVKTIITQCEQFLLLYLLFIESINRIIIEPV